MVCADVFPVLTGHAGVDGHEGSPRGSKNMSQPAQLCLSLSVPIPRTLDAAIASIAAAASIAVAATASSPPVPPRPQSPISLGVLRRRLRSRMGLED